MASSPTSKPNKVSRLGDASVDEINAAYNKIYPELINLAHYYAGAVHIPFVDINAMIDKQVQTPQFKKQAVQIIDDALNAAEAVREAKAQQQQPPATAGATT